MNYSLFFNSLVLNSSSTWVWVRMVGLFIERESFAEKRREWDLVSCVSRDELGEIVREARPVMDSYMNCGFINRKVSEALSEVGVVHDVVEGTVSTGRSHIGGEEHLFVVVDSECVSDVESGDKPVIVDGALDQFCDERYDAGEVFVTLGLFEDIPQVVVLTSSDELYDVYFEEIGW